MFYYKDKQNNFYAFKSPLWRYELPTYIDENGIELTEPYSVAELEAQSFYTAITEEEFNNHLSSLNLR